MSVSLDYQCLQDCRTGCLSCCTDCTKEDLAFGCKEILKRIVIAFAVVFNISAAMMIMYFSNATEKVENFTFVISVFWLIYSTLHMVMIITCLVVGLKEIFPSIQIAFPKTKPFFVYWIFCTIPIWYIALWLPKIVLLISKNTDAFLNTQITTFTCFMVHFSAEVILYSLTCCVKFNPKSEKGSLNQVE